MSAVNSCCSDLREINEAKVQNILSYLDDVHYTTGNHSSYGFGGGSMMAQQQQYNQQQQHHQFHHHHQQHSAAPSVVAHSDAPSPSFNFPLQDISNSQQQQGRRQQGAAMGDKENTCMPSSSSSYGQSKPPQNNSSSSYNPHMYTAPLSQQRQQQYGPSNSGGFSGLGATPMMAVNYQQQQQQQRRSPSPQLNQRNLASLASNSGSAGASAGATAATLHQDPSLASVAAPNDVANEEDVMAMAMPAEEQQQQPNGTAQQQQQQLFARGRSAPSIVGGAMPQRMMGGGGGSASVASFATSSAAFLLPLSNENSSQVYNGIKRKIDELKRANEALLQDKKDLTAQLDTFKEKESARIAKLQKIAQTEVEGMRAEQQRLQSQHMQTIAKIVREKEALVIKCDELAASTRALQEAKEAEARRAADQHSASINEMKGKWLVQEKQRREQWMVAESKRIKDNTLKAMEPDIALLMNRHKAERARIQEECNLTLKRKDEQMAEKDAELQEARLKMGRDLEALVVKERENFRQRMEEESGRYAKAMEELKRQHEDKIAANNGFYEEQKQHYLATIKGLEGDLLRAKGSAAESNATLHATVGVEVQKLMAVKEKELALRQQQWEDEMERHKQAMCRENEEAMHRKEEEYKMIMRQERDAAIAKVVKNLEDEHIRQMSSNKEASSLVKDKMARQDREMERLQLEKQVLEQQTQTLVNQSKATNELVEKLQAELQSVRDAHKEQHEAVEHTFEQRLHGLDRMWQQKLTRFESQHVEEVQQLAHGKAMAEKAHLRRVEELETDLRNLESRHNSELSSINDRVVAAMAKRDATVQMLQEQLRLAQGCIQERESELERHRMLLES